MPPRSEEESNERIIPDELREAMGIFISKLEAKNKSLGGKLVGDFGSGDARALVLPTPFKRGDVEIYVVATAKGFKAIEMDPKDGNDGRLAREARFRLSAQVEKRQQYKTNPPEDDEIVYKGDHSGLIMAGRMDRRSDALRLGTGSEGFLVYPTYWQPINDEGSYGGAKLVDFPDKVVIKEALRLNEERVQQEQSRILQQQQEKERAEAEARQKAQPHIDAAKELADLL